VGLEIGAAVVVMAGRDDFLEKFVVEVVLGPPGNDFGLELFPKLKRNGCAYEISEN
jgi:hypothetical protein